MEDYEMSGNERRNRAKEHRCMICDCIPQVCGCSKADTEAAKMDAEVAEEEREILDAATSSHGQRE